MIGNFGIKEAYQKLIKNDYTWYVVEYTDGSFDLIHTSGVSYILQCGADPAEWGIKKLYQCWNGEEIGRCPF